MHGLAQSAFIDSECQLSVVQWLLEDLQVDLRRLLQPGTKLTPGKEFEPVMTQVA